MIHAEKVGAALLPAKKVGAPLDGPTFFTQTQKRLERQKRPQKGWTVPSFCTRQERRSNLFWMKKGWGVIRFGREAQKRLERRCRTGKRLDRRDAQARRSHLFLHRKTKGCSVKMSRIRYKRLERRAIYRKGRSVKHPRVKRSERRSYAAERLDRWECT